MTCTKSFSLSAIALAITPLLHSPAHAAYQQGDGEIAQISQGETVQKHDEFKHTDKKKVATGELNRAGNAVRVIWYGNPNDTDGKIPQKGVDNAGIVQGSVVVSGVSEKPLPTSKDDYGASIQLENQGNGVDAHGWTAHTNPNNVEYDLNQGVNNRGQISGEATLNAGLAGVHGNIASLGSANGISITGLADFGRHSYSGGGVDGVSGATNTSSRPASGGASNVNNTASEIDEDELANADAGNQASPSTTQPSPTDTSEADFHGKTIDLKLSSVANSGHISGHLMENGRQLKAVMSADNKKDYNPRFYGVSSEGGGNGVSMHSFIDTPDKYTFSEEKRNDLTLGEVNNSGTITGKADLNAGRYVSHTNTRSKADGNAVSIFSHTGRFPKNQTTATLNKVENSGKLMGQLTQISGDNSSYESVHTSSIAHSVGSGNGVSVMAEMNNAQTKQAKAVIGEVNNRGQISGEAFTKAGNGSGDLGVNVTASGNGISLYLNAGSLADTPAQPNNAGATVVKEKRASIGAIHNQGMIIGKIETRAGTAVNSAQEGKSIPEAEQMLWIADKSVSSFSEPETTPAKPAEANSAYLNHTQQNYTALTDVLASGNGISAVTDRGNGSLENSGATLGNIANSGVVSGYAKLYHGFSSKKYDRINFLLSGAGIALDREMTADVTNLGLISGNYAAMLAKGKMSTAFSLKPDYISGYKGTITNHGLMAGALIAGNYSPSANGRSDRQTYSYFNADQDPVVNNGVKVWLESGFKKRNAYNIVRNEDYEKIARIENGAGGSVTFDGKTYDIINAPLTDSQKDSEYVATDNAINHKIINGVGIEQGALIANKALTLENSVVNGYRTALKVNTTDAVKIADSTLNANGFKVNRELPTYAVRGDDQNNDLTMNPNTLINGDIFMAAGDDQVTIATSDVKMNGNKVDMGEGNDTFKLGDTSLANDSDKSPISLDYQLLNAENVEINKPTEISPIAKITGTQKLSLNADLLYRVGKIDHHALFDKERTTPIAVDGSGTFTVDLPFAETELSFGGAGLNPVGAVKYATTSVLHNAEVKEGKIVISVKPAEPEVTPELPVVEPEKPIVEPEKPTEQITVQPVPSENQPEQPTIHPEQPKDPIVVQPQPPVVKPEAKPEPTQPVAKPVFQTPYVAAYQSFVQAWKADPANNPLANSASTLNKSPREAEQAVNNYLDRIVNQNIYSALPNALLNQHKVYRHHDMDQHKLLKQGEVAVKATGVTHRHKTDIIEKSQTQGVLVGVSTGVNDRFTLGATLGAGKQTFNGTGSSELHGNSQYFGLYALTELSPALQAEFGMTTEKAKLKGERTINNGYDAQRFDVRVNPTTTSFYSQLKYHQPLTEMVAIEPKMGIAYNQVKIGQIQETGIGALTLENYRYHDMDMYVGQDLSLKQAFQGGNIIAKLSADYVHSKGHYAVNARFNGGSDFALKTAEAKGSLRLGGTTELQLKNGVSLKAGIAHSEKQWNSQASIGYQF